MRFCDAFAVLTWAFLKALSRSVRGLARSSNLIVLSCGSSSGLGRLEVKLGVGEELFSELVGGVSAEESTILGEMEGLWWHERTVRTGDVVAAAHWRVWELKATKGLTWFGVSVLREFIGEVLGTEGIT